MTAATATAGRRVDPAGVVRSPAEGWLSIGLIGLMAIALAWSIDDAAWVLGRGELTDFLVWAAALGAAAGILGAKIGWSRWLAHLVGAIWAAILIPLIVGNIIEPGSGVADAFLASGESVRDAYRDLVILGRGSTIEVGHYLIVLGLFCWATAMYAGSAVFRDHRPLDATIVLGIALVANMALTLHDQLAIIVIFSLAALLLLIRTHAFDEQTVWLRRRMGDPSELSTFYLRGGTFFVVLAVLGALLLTTSASSNPLAGAWAGAQQTLIDVSKGLERFLPTGGQSRGGGVSFGDSTQISGSWTTDGSLALTIQLQPGELGAFYWRAVTYDTFDLRSWRLGSVEFVDVAAGEHLLDGTLDQASPDGRRPIAFEVTAVRPVGRVALSPATPLTIDHDATAALVDGVFFGKVDPQADTYQVTALVPRAGDQDALGLTENRLRVTGTDYPPAVAARYLQVPDGAVGPYARQLLEQVVALSPRDNPYDLAKTLEQFLRSSGQFEYDDNVTDLDAGGSVVEAFARNRRGYCQYYASTMAILLRELGIPSRVAEGFLPGQRELGTGIEKIYNSQAHMWVEVYFPTYGWVAFDPTGGGRAQLAPLPSGRPEASPSATPGPSDLSPEPTIQDRALSEPDDAPGAGGTINRPTDPGPFIALTLLLLVVIASLVAVAWWRGPRGDLQPDALWRNVGRLAGRFGFAPRPTETVYEYAASLAEVLPDARPALGALADAKVEVAYGRRDLGTDRLRTVRAASRRLRLDLLRLVFRRRDRRDRRRTR